MSHREANGRRRVVVTGLGAYTSLGTSAQASWVRVLAGESGITRIDRWDPASFDLPVGIGGEIKEKADPVAAQVIDVSDSVAPSAENRDAAVSGCKRWSERFPGGDGCSG